MSKLRQTESDLLAVYQKVNPSTYNIETDDAEYRNREEFFSGLIHHRLCFPKKMFEGADLLEFGSGTGEYSLFYQAWGARGTYVEINDQAIARMQALFQHFDVAKDRYRCVNQSIFNFEPDRTWDIVATIGVLHHLEDKDEAFQRVAQCIAPGGFLLFGIGNTAGMFQRNLQRMVVSHFAGEDHDRIEKVAERLFPEHLERAERFGRRSRKAIIYDTYVNPKIDGMSVVDVVKLFDVNGLRLHAAWPPVMPALLGDSANRPAPVPLAWPALLSLVEIVWLAHRDDDADTLSDINQALQPLMSPLGALIELLNDQKSDEASDVVELRIRADAMLDLLQVSHDPYSIYRDQVSMLMREMSDLLVLLSGNRIDSVEHYLKNCKFLFRGTAGLGMNYFVGQRHV